MSVGVRKILTDKGTLYVAFENVIDRFVSPAFATPEDFAAYMAVFDPQGDAGATLAFWLAVAPRAQYVYDLRRVVIHDCVHMMAELKSGRGLNDNQACVLYEFYEFLRVAVPFPEQSFPELNPEMIQQWISDLNIRRLYSDQYDWQDILDNVRCVAFYDAWSKRQYKHYRNLETVRATPEQNKLAGRYLSALCVVTNIAGTGKSSPVEIVEKFYCRPDSGPTVM